MSITSYITKKASDLRSWFKRHEKLSKDTKHPVRMKFYGFMQRTIKRFANWLASHANEETKEQLRKEPIHSTTTTIRWLGDPPEWLANYYAIEKSLKNPAQTVQK